MNFMCFFGDSVLAADAAEVIAYPIGFSFNRPFRYRDEWIKPVLRSEEAMQCLYNKEMLLGMRFIAEGYESTFLPVRKVAVTKARYMHDNTFIRFKMGPLVDYRGLVRLTDWCTSVSDAKNWLLFQSDVDVSRLRFVANSADEMEAWVSFVDLLAKTEHLIPEKVRRSVFLRFGISKLPRGNAVGRIASHPSEGDVYGISLKEGSNCEVQILHRVPALIGTGSALNATAIRYSVTADFVNLSRSEDDYSGNYQDHFLSLFARKPSGTNTELLVSSIATECHNMTIYKLHIPFKVALSFWYRFKKRWFFVLLLFISLALGGVAEQVFGQSCFVTTYLPVLASALSAVLVLLVSSVL